VLYLGEINDSLREAWCQSIEAFDEGSRRHRQLALFSADHEVPASADGYAVQVRLDAMELHRPRQWGACWLACHLYENLELDRFWSERLPDSHKGTKWRHILQTLVCYRLIDPGSEWRLHRQWFEQSAMGDLLHADCVGIDTLYRCLDKLLEHKTALFDHLRQRWQDLFAADFEVLLYDLTSTYFESSQPDDENEAIGFVVWVLEQVFQMNKEEATLHERIIVTTTEVMNFRNWRNSFGLISSAVTGQLRRT
jgi:hypothetical protein